METEPEVEFDTNEAIEVSQNHRVHIVRVVYQNVIPTQSATDKEKKPCPGESSLEIDSRPSPEIHTDNWSCTTCTVAPCRCLTVGQSTTSKCSSCDTFIEAQQQEPGPVQLEYSCRCHRNDVTVLKTVCAKCATKIHELLADILVCERQDHCTGRQLAVATTASTESSADVCSNCQVVGSRIFNSRPMSSTDATDRPPPLPKRKFITRGTARTPPLPKKCPLVTAPSRLRSPIPRRRVQRTRSADSPSDSDSSLSDSSDYPNLKYKPGVVPNEYIESDDFPTSNSQNVPFDISSLNLTDPLIRQLYSNPKSLCRAASSVSPMNSSLSSICASPASVSHSSPETVSSDDPKHSPMQTSVSPSINSSKNSSPITLLENVPSYSGDCYLQTPEPKNYTIVEYHGSHTDSITFLDCTLRNSATGDLIDLRSPLACSPPSDAPEAKSDVFPIVLPEIDSDFIVQSDSESLDRLQGAVGGACTPASFDIDFIVACDEAGVPDLSRIDWPGACEEMTDDVFVDRVDFSSSEVQDTQQCDSVVEGEPMFLYTRTHRRTGSACGRVERADSPPPKLPLKPSLSLNQTPPPVPRRDFRPREKQLVNRPHRVSRPQTFDPSTTRENVTTQDNQDANLPMPDMETNRTVSQLVFGLEHTPVQQGKHPERPEQISVSTSAVSNSTQRKKRPLSCLLKPKHTLNKIFQKRSSKDNRDVSKPSIPTAQRELPPIPVDSRNYCSAEHLRRSMLLQSDHEEPAPDIFCDLPPPLLPREPIQGVNVGVNIAVNVELQAQAQHHNFIDSLIKLREVGWYWGPLSMDKAEAKLADKKDGSFLVRDSSHDSYILSLSFRSQSRTHHTRIEFFHGTFGFWSQPSSHGRMSIVEFIEKAMEHSRNGKFLYFLRPHSPGQAPSPVVLLYPISRYEKLQSLQHSCRFVILKYVRYDHIEQLPLPSAIKLYLKDKHYFAEHNGDSSSE